MKRIPSTFAFISHTRQDGFSERIAISFKDYLTNLENNYVPFFFDEETLELGEYCETRIRWEASSCMCFIAFIGPNYLKRYWTMHELDLAIRNTNCLVIPIICNTLQEPRNFRPSFEELQYDFLDETRVDDRELMRWHENLEVLWGVHYERMVNMNAEARSNLNERVERRIWIHINEQSVVRRTAIRFLHFLAGLLPH